MKDVRFCMRKAVMPAITLLIIAQTGCGAVAASKDLAARAADPVSRQSFYFDTVCQITIYDMEDMSKERADAVITDAYALCNTYENLLSKTREGTDIWRVNHAGGEAVTVDARTLEVVQQGIEYGELTKGAFDITIGQAEDLWDFTGEDPQVPDAEELAEAISHVAYENIVIDEDAQTIQLTDPEAEIDLGGIAKGYITDRVAEQLEENGVTSAIISLGGNIETVGGKPAEDGQQPFVIGIETPYSDGAAVVGSVRVTNGTVVTSGVYERYFTQDGKEYHHILDPATGYPADSDILGVSIISTAGHSADCDALSTTCLILGSVQGKELVESLDGYEAIFITRDNEIITTTGAGFTPVD